MNSENVGCALLTVLLILGVIAYAVAEYRDNKKEYRRGYVQCLVDIQSGKQPQYILVNQPNGTTAWKEDKDE